MLSCSLVALASLAGSVYAHGAMVAVTGANGVTAKGLGIVDGTPRDCSTARCGAQADTSVFRVNAGPCGKTSAAGVIDVPAAMSAAASAALPALGADGSISMTMHQINQDGAGPFKCQIDPTGTGSSFQAMTVTQNVPGIFGLSRTTSKDIPLTAQAPAGMTCTGGPTGTMCLMRCMNPALAGPFGSCAIVGSAGSGAAAANATGNATASTTGGGAITVVDKKRRVKRAVHARRLR